MGWILPEHVHICVGVVDDVLVGDAWYGSWHHYSYLCPNNTEIGVVLFYHEANSVSCPTIWISFTLCWI